MGVEHMSPVPPRQQCQSRPLQDGGGGTGVNGISGPSQDGGGANVTRGSVMRESVELDGAESVLTGESIAPLLKQNQFTMRKKAAQSLMDVALMMANIAQLRTLLGGGPDHMEYFYVLVSLVGVSMSCQFIFAILMFIIMGRESDHEQKEEHIAALEKVESDCRLGKRRQTLAAEKLRVLKQNREDDFHQAKVTNHLNFATTMLVFAITVVNMFITGFGIKLQHIDKSGE